MGDGFAKGFGAILGVFFALVGLGLGLFCLWLTIAVIVAAANPH